MRRALRLTSIRLTFGLATWTATGLAFGMDAQPSRLDLGETIDARIRGDRSNVCLQAARIDLRTETVNERAARCALPRSDAPAEDARFELGSISKIFVGLLAAEMVARGELKLDDRLPALLPKGTAAPAAGVQPMTLADLLTHTSGLPPLPPNLGSSVDPADPYARLVPETVYGPLASLKLEHPPGKHYAYSNWAFLVLSDVLARRAGQPYDVLLTERVLKPLDMRATLVAQNDGLVRGRMANGMPAKTWNVPVEFAGAGGVRSTLADLVKLARAVLGDLPHNTPATLRAALATATRAHRTINDSLDVGLAWHLRKRPEQSPLVFQNGRTGGFSSMLLIDAGKRRASVTLADAAGDFDDLAFKLIDPDAPLLPPRQKVDLDTARAKVVTGRYELQPSFLLTLVNEKGKLFAQATGQDRFELLQDSRGDYYALVADILIRTQHDPGSGKVLGLTLFQGGAALHGRRLDD